MPGTPAYPITIQVDSFYLRLYSRGHAESGWGSAIENGRHRLVCIAIYMLSRAHFVVAKFLRRSWNCYHCDGVPPAANSHCQLSHGLQSIAWRSSNRGKQHPKRAQLAFEATRTQSYLSTAFSPRCSRTASGRSFWQLNLSPAPRTQPAST